ncbi:efflux RND transporter periplasmic adaptor subunit [Streptomyces sp. NRRL F-5123]|uniref:efflux RND transporter periplasmic adaptor subunit n=1 Tax=Streptomyces sp. NRRL F-5123 TaxID=1463856 RepID=UPI0004E1C73D|nr:HlyD family efflux transporter periplasmic adaptor subunit [Streptomyces sp. NRRL F-5123]
MKVLPRRRRAALINSVLGVVVLAGAGGAYAAVHDDGAQSTGSGTARVATVAKGSVSATVSGSGSLVSPSDAGLNFTTGGTLTEVKVKPGDKVKKGQVLAKVDATDAKATLKQDQASLDAAEANLTKVEAGELPASSSNGSSSSGSSRGGAQASPSPSPTPTVDAAQLAQAQAQVTQAQNQVDADERAVDGTTLKAPVAGTVASVDGEKGDTVSGTSGSGSGSGGSGGSGGGSSTSSSSSSGSLSGFIVLTNPAGMQVTANFSEADSLKIKAGQTATVTLNAESGTVLDAKVLSISSLPASSSSGSGAGSSGSAVQYPAVLQITSDTSNLRTGLSASIQVTTATAADTLTVPTAAVSGTGANRSVLVVNKDGSTTRTPVTVGVEGDSTDQITSGLTEGQQVQIPKVASSGSNGFPSGAFPGGLGNLGGGNRFGAAGGGGFRQGAGGR